MEEVGGDPHTRDADFLDEREGLLDAVHEEGLVAVQRLDRDRNATLGGVECDLARCLYRDLPLALVARHCIETTLGRRNETDRRGLDSQD